MKMHSKMMVCVLALLAVSACDSQPVEVLKSPCAGLEGSPCGPKRDVNGWWKHTSPAVNPQS